MKTKLRKLVEMIVAETLGKGMGLVFVPRDPAKVVKDTGDYFISREFGIKLTPELVASMDLSELDTAEAMENNGVLEGEWELSLDINPHYSKGTPARLHGHPDTWHPSDPDEFEVSDFEINGILFYGAKKVVGFSPADSEQLKAIVGDLTEDELDRIREQYIENLPEPDYDDRDY